MRLRRLRLATLTAVAALVIAGCAAGGSDEQGSATASPNSLTLWTDPLYGPTMEAVAGQFTATTGVPVKVEQVASELQTVFVTASQAGTGPDLVMGAHDWIGNLVQNGTIDPIPMTAEKQDLFLPKAIEGVTFNSQIYGVPFALENIALFRNTTLVPDAPATMEDLIATGEELKAQGKTTEVLSFPVGATGDAYHSYPLYTSAGGTVFGRTLAGDYDAKQLELGTPEGIAAMAKIGALGETGEGVLKRSISDNLSQLFTDQQAPFMITGPWNLPAVIKSGVPYAVSAIPPFADGGPARPFVGVQAMYIASKAKNKALAQEFATNFFPTPEVAKQLFEVQPRPPALKSVYTEIAATDADIKNFVDAGQDGDIMPSITAMAAVFAPLGKAEAAIIGGADPGSTMTDTAAAINGQINR